MKAFNVIVLVFLVLLGSFVAMALERFHLQDSRIRRLEDRVEGLEAGSQTLDMRLELRHAI